MCRTSKQRMLIPHHSQPPEDNGITPVPASKADSTFNLKQTGLPPTSQPTDVCAAHLYQFRPDVAAPGLVSLRMASCSSPISLGSCLGGGKMLPEPCRASSASGLFMNSRMYLHPKVHFKSTPDRGDHIAANN